jgi:hypothetical protein
VAVNPINMVANVFSHEITETDVLTPAVAVESVERIVGQ